MLAVNTVGWVIIAFAVAVQPFLSVIVTVYVPAVRPVAVALVPPLGVHAYVYGVVPPAPVAVALPLLPPLQLTFTILPVEAVSNTGCVTVALPVTEQPFASVTV